MPCVDKNNVVRSWWFLGGKITHCVYLMLMTTIKLLMITFKHLMHSNLNNFKLNITQPICFLIYYHSIKPSDKIVYESLSLIHLLLYFLNNNFIICNLFYIYIKVKVLISPFLHTVFVLFISQSRMEFIKPPSVLRPYHFHWKLYGIVVSFCTSHITLLTIFTLFRPNRGVMTNQCK